MNNTRKLTDHDRIRQWAEARNAKPAHVADTANNGDPGVIRLDFPGYSGEEALKPISWDKFFQKFEQSRLTLLVQEKTAAGHLSNFNKLIDRDDED